MARGSRRGQREAAALAALRSSEEPLARPMGERLEDGWTVRSVGSGGGPYRCPGCDQVITGVPHVVAWLHDPEDRRHWHTPCWTARDRRRPR